MQTMLKAKKGMGVLDFFKVLVVGGILAIIGVLIFSQVDSAIPQDGFTAAQNATVTQIENTVLDSFELGVIAFVVMAAVVILSALFLLGRT